MQRRKFVAGIGSLAAGSAAAMGTGAFNFAQVDRGVEVEVVGDAKAYLALKPANGPNGEYVDDSGDIVTVDFGSTTQEGGTGVNDQAEYHFDKTLMIVNQGTQEVELSFAKDGKDVKNVDLHFHAADDTQAGPIKPGEHVLVDFEVETWGKNNSYGGKFWLEAQSP